MLKRLCALSLLVWSAGAASAAAEDLLSPEQLENASTWVLASEQVCGLSLNPARIRAFVAQQVPDMNWALFQFQVDARRKRGIPLLNAEQLQRHCQGMRQVIQQAGWGG
ncbi:hypothetical protein [Inquilinus sp.]|jgi:hypothetical protein|uniref:hypothetical protein n=1 Tax=Inquilinus sp. TaxID=1932117 RepID=UPI0037832F96